MSLDDLSLESSDGNISSAETPSPQSEKQKESSRRAQAQLQKTQKDEKKARSDNDDLFSILSRFINNPLYSELVPEITILLQNNYPSRFLLVLIALVSPEASYYLLEKTGRNDFKSKVLSLYRYPESVEFTDSIDSSLRDWITLWLTLGEQFITHPEASVVLVQKFSSLLESSHGNVAKESLAKIFQFFFSERNVILSLDKARAYSDFILSQLKTSLDTALIHMDSDLKEVKEISQRDLFGI